MPPQSEASLSTTAEPWARGYRLSPHVRPRHYDLTLQPYLKQGTFSGTVAITVEVNVSCEFLAVHAKQLNVTASRVTLPDGVTVFPLQEDAFLYPPHELLVLKAKFPVGLYILHFEFNGRLTDKIVGFYRSEYMDASTHTKRYIATSKFQPTYARQAFPCFDEPGFKSKFTIRLVRPSDGYSALSNMDVEKEIPDSPETGLTTVVFKESVPMVTYLVCFIVSNFVSLEPIIVDKSVPFSVYATPGQKSKTQYGLEIGANITEYYIDYFGIKYPLPKLDMIAIPDFVSGAMEHWGLITYREVNLLYDPTISSSANKQRVATVIGHELAHMWFGNLMTLKWWDDLWLNEGFASYMEYKGVDHAHPEWAMMDQFLIDDLHPVLILDAALSSHPIVQQVGHPDEITELFDTISYNKGAAVIRMLEDFMGQENFQKGITAFLNAYKFENAVTQDLWDELQKVEDEKSEHPTNITQVMDTWTRQMGFPVITVTVNENGDRVLSQSRFLADPSASKTNDVSPFGYKWEVPITYTTSSSKNVAHTWLYSNTSSVTVPNKDKAAWIKFNSHQVGYYRVNYSPDEWTVFSQLLVDDTTALDPSDRANLLEDAFSIADAELVNYDVALEMTKYLTKEDQYVPWSVASTMFRKLRSLLIGTSAYADLRRYLRSLVDSIYNSVTWEVAADDSHLKRRLRGVVLSLACSVGHKKCLDQAKAEFDNWLSNPDNRPDPDIRDLVYVYGMKMNGNEETWDTMWSLYLNEGDAQEKTKLLSGLASVQEPWLLQRFIQYSKNEAFIRSQDFFTVIQLISNNPVGDPIVWDFVRSEWEYLVERFTLNNRYLGRLIPAITKSFATEFKLKEMESFFEQYPNAGAGTAARSQALEAVVSNINWRRRHEASMTAWFSAHADRSAV
ncbi:glutamyl aminopeptidase isoform X2 [Anabrus simplex]|uniref:glutamyl aminopeptidase isoform X2 n=1 Tax=Anabrus simplex TaxID=316456 RepID=UPI0035A2D69B